MKLLSSAPQIILTALLLSVGGVSCTDPARSEKINRANGTPGEVGDANQNASFGVTPQRCDSGAEILDLSAVIAAIETGKFSATTGRLTTHQLRLLTSTSKPFQEVTRVKAGVEDRIIMEQGLIYRSDSASRIAEEAVELLGLVNQDGCKTVSFKTGEEPTNEVAIPQKNFSINLANSSINKLAMQSADGEIRIYEVSGDSKIRVTIYTKIKSNHCTTTEQTYLLEEGYNVDLDSASQEKITMNHEFLNSLSKKMSVSNTVTSSLSASAEENNNNSSFSATAATVRISDADYLGILQRLSEGDEHFRPAACAN